MQGKKGVVHMPAKLLRLTTKPARLRAETAAELRRMLLDFPGLPERERGGLVAALDRLTPSEGRWPFVMISPEQNAAVVRWLQEHSRYPSLAVRLWSELFTVLRRDTGEVTLTRDELAERAGATPDEVSCVMHELAGIGAVVIHRERVAGMRGRGRAVYLMNPNVGTHLAGAARDRAQAEAPALRVVEPAGR
jgi:hypothetical protein